MENKQTIKEKIKEKLLEIIEYENRNLNVKELSEILRKKYKISRSPPMIKRYIKELSKEGKIIYEEDGEKN